MLRRQLVPLALALLVLPAPVRSQTRAEAPGEGQGRLAFMPIIGINWQGARFDRAPLPDSGFIEAEAALGPTNGPLFGFGLEYRATPGLAVEASATYSSLKYRFEAGGDRDRGIETGIAGSQSVIRALGGVRFRLHARAPGYFSLGGGVNYFRPGRNPWTPDEPNRVEVAGYAGAGLDLASQGHRIRIEGRFVGASPSTDDVHDSSGAITYEPRSLVLDFVLTLAYLFHL